MSDDDNVLDPGLGPIDPLDTEDDPLAIPPKGIVDDEEDDDLDLDSDEVM